MFKKTMLLTVMIVSITAIASAGSVSLPETGQTTCYDTIGPFASCFGFGNDGDHLAGVAWPSPRFTDNSDGTISDNLTGLIWLKNANCFGASNWATALTDANGLSSASCGLSDGSSAGDWRLPNVNELESLIINAEQASTFTWLTGKGFTSVQSSWYWSSTTYAAVRSYAWAAADGYVIENSKATSFYVWPVRDPSPANSAPVLGGSFTTAGTVNDNATTAPFGSVTVSDADANNVSVNITFTGGNGTLSGTGLTTNGSGDYTVDSAAAATATTNLQGLTFTPTENQVAPGNTVVTTFTLTPNDGTVDGSSDGTTQVTATSINDAPEITSDGGGIASSVTAYEGNIAVTTVTATDAESDPITFSITGGDDSAELSIDPSSGVLTFNSAPDFDNPLDNDLNNHYIVEVTVDDGTDTDVQTIDVEVTDVDLSADFGYSAGDTASGGNDNIAGVSRLDGGNDIDNLDSGKAKIDLEYTFSIVFTDDTGETPQVEPKLYVAHKNSPTEGAGGDFFVYDLTCSGVDWASGKTCGTDLKLGPASAHKYYFYAKKTDGTEVRLPESGYENGPSVKTLSGWSIASAPRDIAAASLDGNGAFGKSASRWVSTGLDPAFNTTFSGYYETVSAANAVKNGEAYFVNGGSSTLPELSGYSDNTAGSYTMTLQPGWNLIGNHYNGNVLLSSVTVERNAEGPVSWDAAAGLNYVFNSIYYFNGSDWGGTWTSESTPDATLIPWLGYWIYQKVDDGATYKITISKPAQ